MRTVFNHEDLAVYRQALLFCAKTDYLVADWGRKHAISDHLRRASESLVENLAEASAAYTGSKQKHLTYCIGSVLESSACLDIARVKGLVSAAAVSLIKSRLLKIFGMLIGLRKSWARTRVQEDAVPYVTQRSQPGEEKRCMFNHEQLDAYRMALNVVRWMCGDGGMSGLSAAVFSRFDSLATGIVLNIAEGNGRFSKKDQVRFLEIAHTASVKMAAQLDIFEQRRLLNPETALEGKRLLLSVSRLTHALIGRLSSRDVDETEAVSERLA